MARASSKKGGEMPQLFTHGRWVVKPGREEDFVAAWRDFAEWTLANVEGSLRGWLLRDREQRNRFFSFGPWESLEAIEAWRASAGFQERVGGFQELLESFEPYTLDLAAEIGAKD
jgi:heme-degrading monooxygenase HmoA